MIFLKIQAKKVVIYSSTLYLNLHEIWNSFFEYKYNYDKNLVIINYVDRYTQVDIANYWGLYKSLIWKVVKSGDSFTGVWFESRGTHRILYYILRCYGFRLIENIKVEEWLIKL